MLVAPRRPFEAVHAAGQPVLYLDLDFDMYAVQSEGAGRSHDPHDHDNSIRCD